MDRKRSYEDGCAFAQALDLVGERWALLVMRELMFGPRRFTDLQRALPAIATNVLAQRLQGLEAAGVLEQVDLPRPARGRAYALTPWGRAFREPLRVMGAWAARSPALRFDHPLSAAAAMLALESMFDPDRARGLRASLDLRLPEGEFCVVVTDGELIVEEKVCGAADAVVTGDQNAVLSVVLMGARPDEAGLAVEGDREALLRLAGAFRRPEPLAA
jgi:DNA-binding HxlR family transcriptional regulator